MNLIGCAHLPIRTFLRRGKKWRESHSACVVESANLESLDAPQRYDFGFRRISQRYGNVHCHGDAQTIHFHRCFSINPRQTCKRRESNATDYRVESWKRTRRRAARHRRLASHTTTTHRTWYVSTRSTTTNAARCCGESYHSSLYPKRVARSYDTATLLSFFRFTSKVYKERRSLFIGTHRHVTAYIHLRENSHVMDSMNSQFGFSKWCPWSRKNSRIGQRTIKSSSEYFVVCVIQQTQNASIIDRFSRDIANIVRHYFLKLNLNLFL